MSSASEEQKESKRSVKLSPCQACKNVVESFKKGIESTARGKHEGGDAAWEERRLKNYAYSEIRLVEIMEDLCKDVDKGHDQCHSIVENNEEHLEKWWLHDQKTQPDLETYFCGNQLKVCCPENTFGPECWPCPGGIEIPCNGRGKCQGEGTRSGKGNCKCDGGYKGDVCDECAVGYHQSPTEANKLVCIECHRSCLGHCWEAGPKGCQICKDGWSHSADFGCQDVNECYDLKNVCTNDEFCVNLEGSYQCIDCHKSCDGCDGDGPDMCKTCKEGYILQDELCVDLESIHRSLKMRVARYVTYAGLFIATCIVFKKNVLFASILGIAVAVYVAASEYTLTENVVDILPKFI